MFDSGTRRTFALVCAAAAAAVLAALAGWRWTGNGGADVPGSPKTTGRAAIGGPFTLTDHEGNAVTEADFLGRHTLVYFGYTFCPDVCPMELQSITEALERLGPKADGVAPLFITVDPERDTVAVMADYARHFHPSLRALTGTPEEVRAAARAYRAYFRKTDGPEEGDDYLVDHTSLIYVMGPDGAYVAHFTFGTPPDEMAARLSELLG